MQKKTAKVKGQKMNERREREFDHELDGEKMMCDVKGGPIECQIFGAKNEERASRFVHGFV